MDEAYDRDLIGYGANPPHPKWPGGARIALSFVLNYEEGGERCLLHGDDESESFLSEIPAAMPIRGLGISAWSLSMNMAVALVYGVFYVCLSNIHFL